MTLRWQSAVDLRGIRDYDVELEKLVDRTFAAEQEWNNVGGDSTREIAWRYESVTGFWKMQGEHDEASEFCKLRRTFHAIYSALVCAVASTMIKIKKEGIMKAMFRLTIAAITLAPLIACATPAPAPTPAPRVVQTVVVRQTVIATSAPTQSVTAQQTATTIPTSALPTTSIATQPHGITVVNISEPSAQTGSFFIGKLFDDRVYTNPNVAGLTFRTSWADIEPAQGNFVWAKLDTVFDNAEKNGKWVELVLIPGFGSPAWALQGVPTATFSVIYGPGKGDELLLPLPWDQTYLNRWFAFLKAVSVRYQNRPSFIKIAADGPTSLTGEMTLPDTPADLCTWVRVGYTSERLIGAWRQVFANYAQIFPRQYFSLALYWPLPIVSTTRCENGNPIGTDRIESQRVRDIIIGLGVDNYPKQFILQANGLRAPKTEDLSNVDALIKGYGGKVVIGWQLATSAMENPDYMGGVADGAMALQKSLQAGIDEHAQFLEVYEADVLNPAAQNVLATIARALASAAR